MTFSCRKLLYAGAFLLFSLPSARAQGGNELNAGYYITVAAYAKGCEGYAKRFVDKLKDKGFAADYGFNTSRNLYFVYLEYQTDLRQSIARMEELRKTTEFTDAWVRVVPGYIGQKGDAAAAAQPAPEPDPAPEPVKSETPVATVTKPEEKPKPVETPAEKTTEEPVTQQPDELQPEDMVEEKIIQHNPMTLANTEAFLSLFNATNNRIVQGDVQIIDTERGKLIKEVKGNEYILLPDPRSKSGKITLVADAFGYRKVQLELNYKQPLQDTVLSYVELMGTTFLINFDLIRYRKGDISTLYHVYFFNDAAIMLPESQYELNTLLQMMEENPEYKIRLHGHTNGHYHGKILGLGPEKNFFSMNGAVQGIGSAKDLSQKRAETIKEYLVANGIDAARITIKAWAGKRPLYDKHSVNAKKNVRVEVEVLED